MGILVDSLREMLIETLMGILTHMRIETLVGIPDDLLTDIQIEKTLRGNLLAHSLRNLGMTSVSIQAADETACMHLRIESLQIVPFSIWPRRLFPL